MTRFRGHLTFEKEGAQPHAPYAPEFRQQLIELVRAGHSPEQLAEEFGCSAQSIRNWVAQGIEHEVLGPQVVEVASRKRTRAGDGHTPPAAPAGQL